ncbi:mechanosensitive ion channel family protein [Pedobacter metabolipauper]|uniref:Small conductance mechanosensitive channel n=1 Tax=Pedobacter metabolipauper TaxID=425513 RepID=A0A4R6T2W6_9SPHI|nr:mechanosensitive ion channel family protein [Pedobacter metabolipauper]TDQ11880.1 small conductance mechanosensitive channel [Pedobacter metabolipauper]
MNLKDFKDKSADWIIVHGPPIILGVVVLFIGLWLIKQFSKWLNSGLHKKKIDPSLKPFLVSLLVVVLRVLLVIAVIQILGIDITVFGAILGGVTVALGLALSGTLQNFSSGIIILFLKPFSVGDNIIAQGQEGTVTTIKIFYTIITTFDNKTVIVPNSKLSNEVIINISRTGSRRLDIELKFANSMDYAEVKNQIESAIKSSKDILKDPTYRIGISSIESDGYKVMLNLWLNAHGFIDAKMEFQEKLMTTLVKSGLKLPGL